MRTLSFSQEKSSKLSNFFALKVTIRDIGIFPLIISTPFMFYPKIINGDTQPWIFFAALVSFFTFRTKIFINKKDYLILMLPFICIFIYGFRSSLNFFFLRATYIYLMFFILWVVGRREKGEFFQIAIKITTVIWLIVGLYQFLMIAMEVDISISGRFAPGRGGVPSLTSEPAMYGSLSILTMMYLMNDKKNNYIYIFFSLISVFLSGSLFAKILLIFPLLKVNRRFKIILCCFLIFILTYNFYFSPLKIFTRLNSITSQGLEMGSIFLDPSINLRIGHIFFTLYDNLMPSIFLYGPVDFMSQYNSFADSSLIFIKTGSEYIIPTIGEIVYGSGIFGAILILKILGESTKNCKAIRGKLEKLVFITACMLSPISVANIFFIIYAQQRNLDK